MEQKSYPGGKGSSGTYQTIINNMPPHDTYIEPFVGGASIYGHKKPANENIIIDLDKDVVENVRTGKNTTAICGDGIQFLRDYEWKGGELVYCDPPYMFSARTGGALYKYEFDYDQHVELLELIKTLPCDVMLSGYHSKLYKTELKAWHLTTYGSMTRRGMALEHLWCNFESPTELHDYSFLGDDYRERERIKKKVTRWKNKLQKMDRLERQVIIAAINSVKI